MVRIAVALLVLVLVACATYLPFSRQEEAELGRVVRPYVERWGEWDVFHVNRDYEGDLWVAFLWLSESGKLVAHAVVLVQLDGEWVVLGESLGW